MLRVAFLGDSDHQGVLVDLAGNRILVGCPSDIGAVLDAETPLAVLVASGATIDGWPLLCRYALLKI
eukprot:s2583_g3.t1